MNGEMQRAEKGGLSKAFGAYVFWMAMLVILMAKGAYVIDDANKTGALFFLIYFSGAYHLTKKVLPRIIQWHPVYDTLWNVTSAKLRIFLFWPIAFIQILFRLLVDKAL
jgi:hypothetical protein